MFFSNAYISIKQWYFFHYGYSGYSVVIRLSCSRVLKQFDTACEGKAGRCKKSALIFNLKFRAVLSFQRNFWKLAFKKDKIDSWDLPTVLKIPHFCLGLFVEYFCEQCSNSRVQHVALRSVCAIWPRRLFWDIIELSLTITLDLVLNNVWAVCTGFRYEPFFNFHFDQCFRCGTKHCAFLETFLLVLETRIC
jgi:hypothetical protein